MFLLRHRTLGVNCFLIVHQRYSYFPCLSANFDLLHNILAKQNFTDFHISTYRNIPYLFLRMRGLITSHIFLILFALKYFCITLLFISLALHRSITKWMH